MTVEKPKCKWGGKQIVDAYWSQEYCSPKCESVADRVHTAKAHPVEETPVEAQHHIGVRETDRPKRSYDTYLATARQHHASMMAKYGAPVGAKPPQPRGSHQRNY